MTDTPPKPNRRSWLWLVVVMAVPVCIVLVVGPDRSAAREQRLRDAVGGWKNLQCLRQPDAVTLRRLKRAKQSDSKDTEITSAYEHAGEKIHFSGRTLGELLGSSTSYSWPEPGVVSACLRDYAVEAVFHRGDNEVTVWLCFGCSDAMFVSENRRVGSASFEPVERAVLNLVVPAFPDDVALQEALRNAE